MKKIFAPILLVLPILLFALPAFAALSTTPTSSDSFNSLQITVTGNDNRRVILVNSAGIVAGDTDQSHGYPYPFADGTYSPSQLGFTASGYGTYTIISTLQAENGFGSCLPGSTISSCLYMIGQGSGYYNESTFNFFAPPSPATIGSGELVLPSSSTADILESMTNVLDNLGLLSILVLAAAMPLAFWFMREMISLYHQKQK